MTTTERSALVESLKRLCADIAAIAWALEGDGASRDSPAAVSGKAPGTLTAGKELESRLPAPGTDATAETPAETPDPEPEKVYTFEEARSILAEKARNGFRAEVKGLVIPKSDTETVARIHAAMKAAYEEGKTKLQGNGKTVPDYETLKKPLRDGDKEAVCRDLLAETMKDLRRHRIVGHVHDEVIIEAPEDTPIGTITDIMGQTPEWIRGVGASRRRV